MQRKDWRKSQRGSATVAEYALLLAILIVACIGAASVIREQCSGATSVQQEQNVAPR